MIRRRFSVFRGVGDKTEQTIWRAGLADWSDYLAHQGRPPVGAGLHRRLSAQIARWHEALQRSDHQFFAGRLKRAEHWSLYAAFEGHVRYLDIETTGLDPRRDRVTMVGVHDGRHFHALVRGRDLDSAALQQAFAGCKLLVSFFGSVFDVPFLRQAFPALQLDQPHYDLCHAARRLGLTGGLKHIERQLGIHRPTELAEVDGFEAVRLWHRHRQGDPTALETLTAYNHQDTENLIHLARHLYERLAQMTAMAP
jgi:hypothetical protein